MKYNEFTLGQIEAIINKLGGTEGVNDFLSNKTKIVRISFDVLKVWKTIELGNLNNEELFDKVILINKRGDGGGADHETFQILRDSLVAISPIKKEVRLAKVSVRSLGFENSTSYERVLVKAQKLGLELCPNEVGPQLRWQHKDQLDRLFIAMKPIILPAQGGGRPSSPVIFLLESETSMFGTKLSLRSETISSDTLLSPEVNVIFCLRK